ncbi:cell wall hydrolase/autolysin [Desulfofarcimen acetoxidans DSM 771]|uniref:Cell wall hydrolase/autolysin n=1 Tax=Desulfofarcimen acetoxidans (strain ATCC 49208 / DSM 771 / KCTC 5769 / VKM B-1644 / 5575) TaxID=485916 RepID=C8VZE9_DESAS|nr:cell wall hydrolase/autolysin [Desulfofarcimen acetoxidans DSM 771]
MRKNVVLDPGHGGQDPGAIGVNGLQEKKVNWDVANIVKEQLAGYDCVVHIMQPSCTNPNSTSSDELRLPVKYANNIKADFYLSVHENAGGGTGFESHVYTHPSELALKYQDAIHNEVAAYMAKFGFRDRGKRRSNFYVLRETNMPAVLLENLFIDSAANAAALQNPEFLHGLGNAIAYGIVLALGLKKI